VTETATMASHGQACRIFPRRRPGERGPPAERGRDPVVLERATIAQHFGLPQGEAAQELGISLTTLKQACRKLGVQRWPYTKRGGKASEQGVREARARARSRGRGELLARDSRCKGESGGESWLPVDALARASTGNQDSKQSIAAAQRSELGGSNGLAGMPSTLNSRHATYSMHAIPDRVRGTSGAHDSFYTRPPPANVGQWPDLGSDSASSPAKNVAACSARHTASADLDESELPRTIPLVAGFETGAWPHNQDQVPVPEGDSGADDLCWLLGKDYGDGARPYDIDD